MQRYDATCSETSVSEQVTLKCDVLNRRFIRAESLIPRRLRRNKGY